MVTKWFVSNHPPKRPRFKSWLMSQVEVRWRSPKTSVKNFLYGGFAFIP